MIQTQFGSFTLMRSRSKMHQQMIIQKGPFLFDLESLQRGRELEINIKKIHLVQRPGSNSSLTQRKRFLSSPKHQIWPYGILGSSPYPKTRILYKNSKLDENPFQNEALKFPLSKRSYSSIKRMKKY